MIRKGKNMKKLLTAGMAAMMLMGCTGHVESSKSEETIEYRDQDNTYREIYAAEIPEMEGWHIWEDMSESFQLAFAKMTDPHWINGDKYNAPYMIITADTKHRASEDLVKVLKGEKETITDEYPEGKININGQDWHYAIPNTAPNLLFNLVDGTVIQVRYNNVDIKEDTAAQRLIDSVGMRQ